MKHIYGLLLLVLLAIPYAHNISFIEVIKLRTFDHWVTKHEPSGYFTILNITEDEVQAEGGYPFPRQRLAQIQQQLCERGAIGVGWVVSFIDPDRFAGDEAFVQAINEYCPATVVATFDDANGIYPEPTGTVMLGEQANGISIGGYIPNIPIIQDNTQEGLVSAPVDVDNLVRRLPLLFQIPDGWSPSFATQVLKILAGSSTYIVRSNELGIQEVTVQGLPPVKVDSLGRKWISWVDTKETTLTEMAVADTFVFVGVTARGIMPQIATPVGLLEPHKIQSALAESILIENSPNIANYTPYIEFLIYTSSAIATWLLINYLGMTLGLSLFTLLLLGQGYLGVHLIKSGVLIDFTWTLISSFVIGAVAYYFNFRTQFQLRQQIKKQFEHYLDPRQVKRLQNNPELLKLGGEKRYATFLFTDVRGFTALSESVEPEQVTYIINRVLTAQQEAVQRHGGMVDKYIGDAMMAIFNAPLDMQNHEQTAIECGIDIMESIRVLNIDLVATGYPSIAIGLGINTGEAIIGNMGSASRFDYTAIGDAVNTAARLESATKEVGVNMLIGKSTKENSNMQLQSLIPIHVKGKEKPLHIYTI
jgi:adenylate cyclase